MVYICSVLNYFLRYYNKCRKCSIYESEEIILIITKKDDGQIKTISIRIGEVLLEEIDRIADETNRSRNDIITSILKENIDKIVIE